MGSLRISALVITGADHVASWFLDDDIDTVEKLMIWMWVGIGSMIMVLSTLILAAPPPWFKGVLPILPPRWWAILYYVWAVMLWRGRSRCSWKLRHVSSYCALITSGFLLCPLWLKAPAFCGLMCFLLVPQAALTARLKQLTRSQEEDNSDCECSHELDRPPHHSR